MVDYLASVSWISLILLVGIFISAVATKLKVPDILFLLFFGVAISALKHYGVIDYNLTPSMLITFSLFAMVMIVFEGTSSFKIKKLGKIYPYALKLVGIFLLLCVTLFASLTFLFFFMGETIGFWQIFGVAVVFAGLMSDSSSSSIFALLKGKASRIIELIRVESLANSTTSIIIPFLIIGLLAGEAFSTKSIFLEFSQGIITGVGTGIVLGLLAALLIKKLYLPKISPLFLIAIAFAAYTLSENLRGNGILAVTAFGLVFGNVGIHSRKSLKRFTSIFTNFLKIIVFILLGMIISVPLNATFFIKSLVLFAGYIAVRYLSVWLSFRKMDITRGERWFISLTGAKGMDVGVMTLVIGSLLASSADGSTGLVIPSALTPAFSMIFSLALIFIVYSLVVATFVAFFSDKFLRKEKEIIRKELRQKAAFEDFEHYSV